ncbi:hypothetical protein [Caldalkalibacillus mannanilyticus]|uniref:hypothetical protein n=1 Tax=Caldalkalibacillus mannanilyticus TaxID=1418 RepID=UPI000468E22B|nr:hypothetical protein [Caldalkalibacillus mannanilyticus]
MNELIKAIKDFESLLEKHPDDSKSVHAFNHFLRYFLRIKTKANCNLPSIEIMTILKHRKPVVYMLMRRQAQKSGALGMLTYLEMDLEEANRRIDEIKKSKCYH